ncbi:hypothetical protein [Lacinutrix sp. MEBiC02595]
MPYYTKKTDRMDIHIEADRSAILIKQKWQYTWLKDATSSDWNYIEKKTFHKKVDNLIWNNLGKSFYLKVTGNSDFAKQYAKVKWDVNFDIEWVLESQHWEVLVTKYPSGYIGNPTSSVSWGSKKINLDTKDTSLRKRVLASKSYYQYPLTHEFGHAVGNSIYASSNMHGDEYNPASAYYNDRKSLMNIGNTLKDRHLDYIISQLNTMLNATKFSKY